MGVPFSNSEAAAEEFVSREGMDADLIPLVTSQGVVAALLSRKIDYGVVAVRNIKAGIVAETEEALSGNGSVTVLKEIGIPIHHCLFKLRPNSTVKMVASHPQALAQTKDNLSKLLPGVEKMEVEDTALAATMLRTGELPETAAVICTRAAGEHSGLYLMKENIEDDSENLTYFALLAVLK